MGKFYVILILINLFSIQVAAQNSDSYFKKVEQVKYLAKTGIEGANTENLIEALRILIKNPKIRPLNLEPNDPNEDYYNAHNLLKIAMTYAKSDPKSMRKLKRLRRHLGQNVLTMTPDPENINIPGVEDFLLGIKSDQIMYFDAKRNQHIIINCKEGEKIGIAIYKANSPITALQEHSDDEKTKKLHIDIEKGERYLIKVVNRSNLGVMLQLAIFADN